MFLPFLGFLQTQASEMKLDATHRLMELRRKEPDFLFRVVQISRSLNRNRERSFFPPTDFYREKTRENAKEKERNTDRGKDRETGTESERHFEAWVILHNNHVLNKLLLQWISLSCLLTASITISCLRNFL